MRHVFKDIAQIKAKLRAGYVLFLDFDLTLSPLAKNPHRAFLPKAAKNLLKKIAAETAVVIVTGRGLEDIKKRVGIRNISYIGNHGLEHDLRKKHEAFPIPVSVSKALVATQKELMALSVEYPGIVFEDKKHAFALGYRLIQRSRTASLETILAKAKKHIEKAGLLEARLDNKTFEVRPSLKVDKGTACRLALEIIRKRSGKKFVPIYIGDSETDEDAFDALKKQGITVRVGKSGKSSACWYVRNRAEVILFLKQLPVFRV